MTLATNSLTNELGDGAPDFPVGMPTVGGDPIVESGSNSDGNWTRWADGTQHVSGIDLMSEVSSGLMLGEWSYPIPFIAKPIVTGQVYDFRDVSGATTGGNVFDRNSFGVRARSATQTNIRGYSSIAFSSGDVVAAAVAAQGRWK